MTGTANASLTKPDGTPGNRGIFTSEFLLTVLGVIVMLVLVLANKVDADVGVGAISTATFGYALSRGIAKT